MTTRPKLERKVRFGAFSARVAVKFLSPQSCQNRFPIGTDGLVAQVRARFLGANLACGNLRE